SSEIENIVTTTDELFRADTNHGDASATTREALRYKIALFHGQERMHERAGLITAGMAKDICSEIRGTITDLRQGQGTYIGNPLTGRGFLPRLQVGLCLRTSSKIGKSS